ncbi:Nitrous-oxide reductase [uncultured archaeon]|nr:Nitrous-oxide reductase [uncultured archaeon]
MKKLLALTILLTVIAAGCLGSEPNNTQTQQSGTPTTIPQQTTVKPTTEAPATTPPTEPAKTPQPTQTQESTTTTTQINQQPTATTTTVVATAPAKEFTMTAKQFAFDPATITVNKGDHVIIHLTSTDVAHGFAIDELNVNVVIPAGKTADADFIADKTGTFTYYCSVRCGSGHRDMVGTLTVQ